MGNLRSKPFNNKQIKLESGDCFTTNENGNITLSPCQNDPRQLFDYLPSGQLKQGDKCVIVDGATTVNGHKIKLDECRVIGDIRTFNLMDWFRTRRNNPILLDQSWNILGQTPMGRGGAILNRLSNKCITISRGNEIETIIWDCGKVPRNDRAWKVIDPIPSLIIHEGIVPDYDIQLTNGNELEKNDDVTIVGPRMNLEGDGWNISNLSFEFDLLIKNLPEIMKTNKLNGPELYKLTMDETTLSPGTVLVNGMTPGETVQLSDVIVGPNTYWEVDGYKFYNPTKMQINYIFNDTVIRNADTPKIGAPFQSGIVQITDDCLKSFNTLYPGTYDNYNKIGKMVIFPMTSVKIDDEIYENNTLEPREYNFCDYPKMFRTINVAFSPYYIGIGVSRITPQSPLMENFKGSINRDFYQGMGAMFPYQLNSPENPLWQLNPNLMYSFDYDPEIDGRFHQYATYDDRIEFFGETNNIKTSPYWTDLGLETLSFEAVDCGDKPILGWGIETNPEVSQFNYKFECGDEEIRGANMRSRKVLLADLTRLFQLNVNCDGRAILGMQGVLDDHGNYHYVYRCGSKPLQNMTYHNTDSVLGRADNIGSLLNTYMKCPEGRQLSAWALQGYYYRPSPHGDLYALTYKYHCGIPYESKNVSEIPMAGVKPSKNKIIENFDNVSNQKFMIIIIIIIIVLICYKKIDK